MIEKQLTIGLWEKLQAPITVVQYEADSRSFLIQLTSGSVPVDLTGASVVFYAVKPDNTILYNACTVEDAANGKISYTMTEQTCAAAGELQCWIEIIKTEDVLRTQKFAITVQASEDSTAAIESTSEFTALEVALADVAQVKSDIADRVVAPGANTDERFPQWDGANTKTLKDGYTLAELTMAVKQSMYRVGDIIMSTSSINPSAEYGGTWVAWGAGRVPVGIDTSDTDFDTVEKTGGEKEHQLTIDEMPEHHLTPVAGGSFLCTRGESDSEIDGLETGTAFEQSGESGGIRRATITSNIGNDEGHNNLQPFMVCYMWKKTA